MVPSKISDQATLLSPNNEGDEEKEEFIFHGPNSPPLRDINVAQYLSEQKTQHPYKAAVTSRWQNITRTYETLHSSTQEIAKSLLCHGVRPGDRVIVLAGNSVEYVELFLAIGSIGAIFAIINPTFTADEVEATVEFLGKQFSLKNICCFWGPLLTCYRSQSGIHRGEDRLSQ